MDAQIRPFPHRFAGGFTLIEVMIVIAIIAGILAVGAPRLFDTSTQKRATVRRLGVITREVRNLARLTRSTMRIVISMNDEKGHSYWIESASGNVTILSAEQEKEREREIGLMREEEKPKSEFQMDSRILRKPETLPRGLFFESVELAARPEPVQGGVAFVHFFSQGLGDLAVIHLTDRKTQNWTVAINPLTGRADVYERKVSMKELTRQ